jgi:hypothetical protein
MDYTDFRAQFFDVYQAHVAQKKSPSEIQEEFKQQAFVYVVSHHDLFKIGMVDDALFRRLNEYRTILREYKVHFVAGFPKGKYQEALVDNHARNAEWFMHQELAAHRMRFPSYVGGVHTDQGGSETEIFHNVTVSTIERTFERMMGEYPAQKYGHTKFFKYIRRLHPVFAFKVRAGTILPVRGVVTFAEANTRPARRTWQDDEADEPRLRQEPAGTLKGNVSLVVRDNRRKQSIGNLDIYGQKIPDEPAEPTKPPARRRTRATAKTTTESLIGRRVQGFEMQGKKRVVIDDGVITKIVTQRRRKMYYVEWSSGEWGEYVRWRINLMLV